MCVCICERERERERGGIIPYDVCGWEREREAGAIESALTAILDCCCHNTLLRLGGGREAERERGIFVCWLVA